MRRSLCALGSVVMLATFAAGEARADAIEDFYHGKTVTVIVGVSPGGTYDATARLLAKHMPAHMPGKPTMVVQNLLGAGGTNAIIHLYNSAAKDGTVIGMPPRNFPIAPYFNPQLKYDGKRFNAVGSTTSEVAVGVVWHTVPVNRIDDVFTHEISVGATGFLDDTGQLALMTKNLTGARIRLVTGYPGGNDIGAAMEKGEVDARFGWSWGSVKSRAKNWLDEKKIKILIQMGLKKAADLPDTPFIMDYAKSERDRQAMELLLSPQGFAWPFVAPPGVPQERVAALRKAFDGTMKDPAFIADAKKLDIEVDPMSGEEMQALINRVLSFDKPAIERAQELVRPPK